MLSGSMRRVDLEITGRDSPWTPRSILPAVRVVALWPFEAATAWLEGTQERRAARRAAEAEERRLEWWRSH